MKPVQSVKHAAWNNDARPGGLEIRRKKSSTYETGGFVIPL